MPILIRNADELMDRARDRKVPPCSECITEDKGIGWRTAAERLAEKYRQTYPRTALWDELSGI